MRGSRADRARGSPPDGVGPTRWVPGRRTARGAGSGADTPVDVTRSQQLQSHPQQSHPSQQSPQLLQQSQASQQSPQSH